MDPGDYDQILKSGQVPLIDGPVQSPISPSLFSALFDAHHSHLFRDFEHLYAYQSGEICRKLMWDHKAKTWPCGRQEKLKTYKGTPSIMAIEPKTEAVREEIDELCQQQSAVSEEYLLHKIVKDPSNFKMIDVGKIEYTKPVQIVYNPNSGKKVNIKAMMRETLDREGIRFDIFETQGRLDAFNFIRDMDIENRSAIALVGGDGTIHEGINGLMARADKRKVPICLIPNGSGNDNCRGLSLFDPQTALNYLIKGHLIKTDLVKVLLDYETEEELDQAIADGKKNRLGQPVSKEEHLSYSCINSSFCILANISRNCSWLKSTLGSTAYVVQTLIELSRKRKETMDLEIDGGRLNIQDITTQKLCVYNGKFGGGGLMLSPLGIINDGLLDISYVNRIISSMAIIDITKQAGAGGFQNYYETYNTYRAKTVRVINKSKRMTKSGEELAPQDIDIDGESLEFLRFAKYECLKHELELIVDFEHIVDTTYLKSQ